VWGEGEPDYFATREEAKADAARQWAEFVLDETDAALAGHVPQAWQTGEPPKWFDESFIARLDDGERVVLRRLPEEYTYDYTTADGTYYKAHRLASWMQFPDSQYLPLAATPQEPTR
jgi:hypothetical protein